MSAKVLLPLTLLIFPISGVLIPFIRDAIFVPLSRANSTTITNYTCNQCLCMNMTSSSQLLLNCLPNNTCQFFSNFPRTYKLQQTTNASLYFPQGFFPNASQCCMPNLTYLLNRLRTATPTYGRVNGPRCLAFDNHGYVITLSQTNNTIVRFNSTNMAVIDTTSGLFTSPYNIKYYNSNYYVGLSNYILVINSNTLTIQNNITSINLSGTRDMMFINNGNILVVVSTNNNRFLLFNRSNNSSTNYNYIYQQMLNYSNPHGLFAINDTFFYATSWAGNTVRSYSALQNATQLSENLFINALPFAPSSSGNHITPDECGRWWFSLGDYGLKIFDDDGSFLDNMTLTNASIFDTIITENYVFYLSDTTSNRIIRIDPDIQC